jgi:hypothetical protein
MPDSDQTKIVGSRSSVFIAIYKYNNKLLQFMFCERIREPTSHVLVNGQLAYHKPLSACVLSMKHITNITEIKTYSCPYCWRNKRYDDERRLAPYHDDGHDGDADEHGEEFEGGSVHAGLLLGAVPLGDEVVDGHVQEHPRGEAHGDGERPVRRPALGRGVDADADAHANGAGHRERQRVGQRRHERALGDHAQQRDAHGHRREHLVQPDRPQVAPRVALGRRDADGDPFEDGVEAERENEQDSVLERRRPDQHGVVLVGRVVLLGLGVTFFFFFPAGGLVEHPLGAGAAASLGDRGDGAVGEHGEQEAEAGKHVGERVVVPGEAVESACRVGEKVHERRPEEDASGELRAQEEERLVPAVEVG